MSLKLIDQTTISSAVDSVNIDNVFSSTYNLYKIVFQELRTASTSSPTYGNFRFIDNSGSVNSSTVYDYALQSLKTDSNDGEVRSTGNTSWGEFFSTIDGSPQGSAGFAYIYNPYSTSTYKYCTWQTVHEQSNSVTRSYRAAGVYRETGAQRGFQIVRGLTPQITGGIITTYGVQA
tara:strand:+ start:278 stop:805 length:528 start_codon:yes stop_codon:yes gene_type:complete